MPLQTGSDRPSPWLIFGNLLAQGVAITPAPPSLQVDTPTPTPDPPSLHVDTPAPTPAPRLLVDTPGYKL